MNVDNKTVAIIVCAGSGNRMNSNISKQFMEICGLPVIIRTLITFDNSELIDSIILVIGKNDSTWYDTNLAKYNLKKDIKIIVGGETRFDSVKNGLNALSSDTKYICIHDGVRCLITENDINDICKIAYENDSCIAVQKSTDTLKLVSGDNIVKTLKREEIFRAQTPQVFRKDLFLEAVQNNNLSESEITDDSILMESYGKCVKYYICGPENIKITTQNDLFSAEKIIIERNKNSK